MTGVDSRGRISDFCSDPSSKKIRGEWRNIRVNYSTLTTIKSPVYVWRGVAAPAERWLKKHSGKNSVYDRSENRRL